MDRPTRSDYINEAIEKLRRKGIGELYMNLYCSELKRIQKQCPDIDAKETEPLHTRRKILCVIKLKSKE